MDVESVASLLGRFGDLPGVGVDVEQVDRFTEPDGRLLTAAELAFCANQPNPAQSRAGRWCAKEAVSKACAKYLQLALREIEIRDEPSGRPVVLLSDRATGIGLVAEVSISYAGGTATAVAVAVVGQTLSTGNSRDLLTESSPV